jgi:hypothetical protein
MIACKKSGSRRWPKNWNSSTATASILKRASASKCPLLAQTWVTGKSRAQSGRGLLLVIDYGYTRNEQLAGTPSRHADGVPPSLCQFRPLPGSWRAGPDRPRQFHRARRRMRVSGMRLRETADAIAISDGYWRKNQFADAFEECRVFPQASKGCAAAQTPDDPCSRRWEKTFASADCQPRIAASKMLCPKRTELWGTEVTGTKGMHHFRCI